ncbi:hypothetical protein C8R44DRAFT_3929 [Mycena epipterygia]|nr:hypothetical protein C8R44DRAFT_3929 [Mycena epipterygia]
MSSEEEPPFHSPPYMEESSSNLVIEPSSSIATEDRATTSRIIIYENLISFLQDACISTRILDRSPMPSSGVWNIANYCWARRIICKLSESCDKLPSALFITGVSEREECPTFGGGYGDIYRAS